MRTTIIKKGCMSCHYGLTGKCPIACQFSQFCPKEATKPLLNLILKQPEQANRLFTVPKN